MNIIFIISFLFFSFPLISCNVFNGIISKVFGSKNLKTCPNRSDAELKEGIAHLYDQSSEIWLDIWGPEFHHGYYPTKDYTNHKEAQVQMIERALRWGLGIDLDKPFKNKRMVDVGCGVGGSSRHIVKKYGGSAKGISLSSFQINKANELSKKINLEKDLQFLVADAMNMPFPSNSFDLTWSMESGEHMPDKNKFFNELYRVTAPDGRIIIVTWCHRELQPGETSLKSWEIDLLHKISKAYYLPEWVPRSTYVEIAQKLNLKDIRFDDWTEYVEPFWPAVIKSALVPKNFISMLKSGLSTIKGAIAALWMREGLKKGVIKFVLITGKK